MKRKLSASENSKDGLPKILKRVRVQKFYRRKARPPGVATKWTAEGPKSAAYIHRSSKLMSFPDLHTGGHSVNRNDVAIDK